jgi:hypothetical protein
LSFCRLKTLAGGRFVSFSGCLLSFLRSLAERSGVLSCRAKPRSRFEVPQSGTKTLPPAFASFLRLAKVAEAV